MEQVIAKPGLKGYPKYRNSGLQWLPEIPEHWSLIRANYIFKVINERSSKGSEELLSVSEHHGVRPRSDSNVNMFLAESYEGYKLCRPGDLVINSLWAWSRGLGFSKHTGIVSTAYSVYRPNHNLYDNDYLHYLLRTDNYVAQYVKASKGIWISRLQLSDWSFLRLPILSPPKPEQTLIARFLDRKTAQIDKAIAQKEKLIELLKERRQILIHNAVTKGLNPNVKMKDSGVEWIGEIPEHWEVSRLKNLCGINQDTLSEDTSKTFELTYVDIGSVTLEEGITQTERFYFRDAPSRARRRAKPGDTIISTVRTYLKAIDFIDDPKSKFTFSTGFAILHPNSKVYPEYLAYSVRSDSFTNQVTVNSKGMSYPAINSSELGRLCVPYGPIEEQIEIISYIKHKKVSIEKSITHAQKGVEVLKEYKSTLINSAVTGKIKVPDLETTD